ncbi:MAG: ABC transporter permease [bacterium]|nr:ABC transporter permease [bacterium]
MRLSTLHRRSLLFYWQTNLAVVAGVIVASAALTGALLVGDSMRASLRDLAVARLGRVEHALVASRYFRETVAADLAADDGFGEQFSAAVPIILLGGGVTHSDSRARVEGVQVLGLNQRFSELGADPNWTGPTADQGRVVFLNEPLARELGAEVGQDVLLRLGKPNVVPTETLLGRRDDTTLTLRLTVADILPADGLGGFGLNPGHRTPRNALVPLPTLQRLLGRSGRVNAVLVSGRPDAGPNPEADVAWLQYSLNRIIRLEDLGLTVRPDPTLGYVALESNRFLLEPAVEAAARVAAKRMGTPIASILTYLANGLSVERLQEPEAAAVETIPYSTVTALDETALAQTQFVPVDGETPPSLEPGEILLNEWAATSLNAQPGDRIKMSFYTSGPFGQLDTTDAVFTLHGVVQLTDGASDPGFTPAYPGVTDVENLAAWDPPFPMDLNRVRPQDEEYWDRYRATPKAFICLDQGQALWADNAERLGRLTSMRLTAPVGMNPEAAVAAFERALLQEIDTQRLGLRFDPVKTRALTAAAGSTDFGMLFIGFSFFLIASAAMLVALLFRLGVERRTAELGLLLAVGFAPGRVLRNLLAEGAVLAGVGTVLGIAAARGYAWLSLAGLRSWWSAAVNAPFLTLHASPTSLVGGGAASFSVAMFSIVAAVRGLRRSSPRALLGRSNPADASGRPAVDGAIPSIRRYARSAIVFGLALGSVGLALLPAVTDDVPPAIAFFCSGAALLSVGLLVCRRWLRADRRALIHRPGRRAILQLGLRNATRHAGQSLLTLALIASATFLIVSLQALHMDVDADPWDRNSGTGRFACLAESALPLQYDLNTADGREALNLPPAVATMLDDAFVVPFRLRPGQDSSCLNLYKPTEPRIVGASPAMIDRGGFPFASVMTDLKSSGDNPWRLLHHEFADGAVPVIGDEAAVKWQLHLGLGQDLEITDEGGQAIRLRFVALLKGSALQDELVVAESHFRTLFPSISGYAFFLIDVPIPPQAMFSSIRPVTSPDELSEALERELAPFGFDVSSTTERLARYLAVQNTYLSTFQTLGGFGLVLGTVGLGAVLLRNIWERRGETALLRAVGYGPAALGGMLLVENAVLVVGGLVVGSIPAVVAVAPHLAADPSTLPWASLSLTLAAILAVGMTAGAAALLTTLRTPLLPVLRSE